MDSNKEIVVGSIPLPRTAQNELSDFMARLDDLYEFKNGATAAYWHLAHVLSEHLTGGKK
jgi:hypothetical protein